MGIEEIRRGKEQARMPKEKKVYRIPKVSKKKAAQLAFERDNREGEDTELQKWFKDRQKQLHGQCQRCGQKYNHTILKNAIVSTCHILPKRPNMFPSIALHPLNFWESSPYCGCHKWYDDYASWEEISLDKIFPLIKEKFIMMEPSIKERGKIPDIFLSFISLPFEYKK